MGQVCAFVSLVRHLFNRQNLLRGSYSSFPISPRRQYSRHFFCQSLNKNSLNEVRIITSSNPPNRAFILKSSSKISNCSEYSLESIERESFIGHVISTDNFDFYPVQLFFSFFFSRDVHVRLTKCE